MREMAFLCFISILRLSISLIFFTRKEQVIKITRGKLGVAFCGWGSTQEDGLPTVAHQGESTRYDLEPASEAGLVEGCVRALTDSHRSEEVNATEVARPGVVRGGSHPPDSGHIVDLGDDDGDMPLVVIEMENVSRL